MEIVIHKKRWQKLENGTTMFFTACGLTIAQVKEKGHEAIVKLRTQRNNVPMEVNCDDCLRVASLEKLTPDIKCSNCGVVIMPQVQKRERVYPRDRLSMREAQIAAYLVRGLKATKIAELCNVAEKTIKFHSTAIYKKTKVSGKAELSHKFHTSALDLVSMELIGDFYHEIETTQSCSTPGGEVPLP